MDMIRCEGLTEADLDRIGTEVALAFQGEPGCFADLPFNIAEDLFRLIIRTCYRAGHLYTTGCHQEGFCVYWTKKQRPGLWIQLKMLWGLLFGFPQSALFQLRKSLQGWPQTEHRYGKYKDYVEVFLLAVCREYQGQGHFRRMLEEPFRLAQQRGTICVLDTDSQVKAEKYAHVGMHCVESKTLSGGITMYAMEK